MARSIATILILILLAAGGWFSRDRAVAWLDDYLQAAAEEPVPVVAVTPREYLVTVRGSGELTGLQTTPVATPPVRTGSLKVAWLAEEGTLVGPGDVLVEFDNTDALLTLEQNQNSYSSFDFQIQRTEVNVRGEHQVLVIDREAARLEEEYAENQVRQDEEIFSLWEIQESIVSAALAAYRRGVLEDKGLLRQHLSQADLEILEIERRKADGEMQLARQTLSSLLLTSPVEGILLYRRTRLNRLQVGDEVWPGQPLVEVANLRQFKGNVLVAETDIAGVERGKKVRVVLNAMPGETFEAVVQQVATVAQQVSRSDPRKYFNCEIVLTVPVEVMDKLKPGMRLRADIEAGHHPEALVLPKSAVIKMGTGFSVFVRQGESYREKKVEVVDGDHGFYVVRGLEEGEQVCLKHPFEREQLRLPDFSAPSAPTQSRRFVIYY